MKNLPDIAKELRAVLVPQGFARKSSTWRRDLGEFVDIIEFQRGRFSADFTINVGVLTKSTYETLWGKAAPPLPRAYECTIYDRIAYLYSDSDEWWDVGDAAAIPRIANHIRNSVFPFMDQTHSREAQVRYLRERKIGRDWSMPVNEAIPMFECGERAEACERLREYTSISDAILKRVADVATRLNCPKL